MKRYFNHIVEASTLGFQYIKETTGTTQIVIDPQYESACEQWKILQERLMTLRGDIESVLKCLPTIYETGKLFSSSVIVAESKTEKEPSTLSHTWKLFFDELEFNMEKNLISKMNQLMAQSFDLIREKFDELSNLKDKRRKCQLLTDSLRDKLENISSSGKPEEIAQTKMEFDSKKLELESITSEFVSEVNELWNKRIQLIESPLHQMISYLFEFGKQAYLSLSIMKTTITTEELNQDYLKL